MSVAVAETSAQRTQGLRGVESLPAGMDGMIFSFGEPRPATFGMRDTRISLDIWWFDQDGGLLGSARMEPCPAEPCPGYSSPGAVSWALETPAGSVEFTPGDRLELDSS